MDENIVYKLDLEKIANDFKFKDNSLIHSQCNEFKLLPYAANEKTLVSNFNGVIGAFSRIICSKELKGEFNAAEFIENVAEFVGEFEGTASKESFKDIVRTMFIDKDNKLVNFNIETINYISSTNADEKVAKFLYSVFFSEYLKEKVKEHYDRDVDNILYKLVLKALPELKKKNILVDEYKCYLPFVKELFIKDFKFLLKDEELYKNSIKRFLEYYYIFYVSQLSMKLGEFEKADLGKPDKLYFSLGWESISKNRTAYIYGLEKLKIYAGSLFSHAITLEFLNHNNLDEQLGYKELFDIFNKSGEEEIEKQIEELCNQYIERRQDGIAWNEFKIKICNSGNKAFDKVYKLFEVVEYQFQGKTSTRSRANAAYNNWFIKFTQENFGKRRGSLGYSLNLNEEDIILLTKICINDNKKLKLSVLFDEFEKRGISFDRDSQIKIIQLYEKLNLLEKKSDSGDAQYVRSIL
ncbi:DNA phosphorothioation-dependent restriction protein DptG [Clostridium ljungdahlii]|uniref:DNA phosphorothioation-dependent restriction protein DptG n=1 Tax=Clostridium ljungdahlii TaxID=1538 RepID=UPI00386353E6